MKQVSPLRLIDGDLAEPLTADQRAARKRDILAGKLRRALDGVRDVERHLRAGPNRIILEHAREEIGVALYMVEHCVLGISCPDDPLDEPVPARSGRGDSSA
jgi:hypothetical protein